MLEIGINAAWEQNREETAKIRIPGNCVSCDYRDLCGACAAVYFTETGRLDAVPEYVYRRAEEIYFCLRTLFRQIQNLITPAGTPIPTKK